MLRRFAEIPTRSDFKFVRHPLRAIWSAHLDVDALRVTHGTTARASVAEGA